MKKQPKIYTFLVTIPVGCILGLPLWILYRWGFYDAIPFVIGWLIAHPVYKLWKEIEL